jgi:hypothetical protein
MHNFDTTDSEKMATKTFDKTILVAKLLLQKTRLQMRVDTYAEFKTLSYLKLA